jgi:Condensation domain
MRIGHSINRRLSPMEKSQWLTDRQCCSNFLSHARFSGALNQTILQQALEALQERHPLLRVRIVEEGRGNARFISDLTGTIPVRSVRADADQWAPEAEVELNTRFDTESAPLLRCVLIQHDTEHHTVLLVFHHSIGDGLSGAYLMRDLFSAADAIIGGEKPSLPPMAPKQAMEAYFPNWVKGAKGRLTHLGFIADYIGLELKRERPARLKKDGWAPFEKRSVHIHALTIKGAVLERLHRRAKHYHTTVHGAMLAAMILAMARDLDLKQPRLFSVGSPVNLRKHLHPPMADDVGFSVAMGFSTNSAKRDTAFWPLAKATRQFLYRCVEKGIPFVLNCYHKDLDIIPMVFGTGRTGARIYSAILNKMTKSMPGFSNIGRLSFPMSTKWLQMDSIGFAASGSVLTDFTTFAATAGDLTTWNFVGMAPIYTRDHIRRIARDALGILEKQAK